MNNDKKNHIKHDYLTGPDDKGLYKCSHCRELKTAKHMFITCLCKDCIPVEYTKADLWFHRQLGRAEGERTERKRVLVKVRELGIELPELFDYMLEYDEGSEEQLQYMKEFGEWMGAKK